MEIPEAEMMEEKNTGKICVSVAARSMDEALELARQNQENADVIEIRLDTIDSPAVAPFIQVLKKPLIFTNRPKWEGGFFEGDEEQRMELLLEAIASGAAYVDIEMKAIDDLRAKILQEAKKTKTKVIVSWHDFKTTASSNGLATIFQEQYRSGANIGKIVTMAREFKDVLRILRLQNLSEEMGFPLIAFAMGRKGLISRIATLEMNGFMTYAAPDNGQATAPGQFPVSSMRRIMKEFENAD
mgnify:CR=1 FL=1